MYKMMMDKVSDVIPLDLMMISCIWDILVNGLNKQLELFHCHWSTISYFLSVVL